MNVIKQLFPSWFCEHVYFVRQKMTDWRDGEKVCIRCGKVVIEPTGY